LERSDEGVTGSGNRWLPHRSEYEAGCSQRDHERIIPHDTACLVCFHRVQFENVALPIRVQI
jgi:hypothetical protein